jgi:hypothetical protein
MARLMVSDQSGRVTVEIETSGPVLGAALEDQQAEPVVRCAVLMALSALAEGGGWPTAALQTFAGFMASMKTEIRNEHLM